MKRTLNILRANVWKSQRVQEALYNDPDIWDFDIILIQEPHYYDFYERTLITGVGFKIESIISTNVNRAEQEGRIRSCI
jgi:hypothetical protein